MSYISSARIDRYATVCLETTYRLDHKRPLEFHTLVIGNFFDRKWRVEYVYGHGERPTAIFFFR